MLKCVKITSFFILLFKLLPDTTSTVSGNCDFLRSCVNYKYRKKIYFKGTTYAYLLKILITHNKRQIPLLYVLFNCLSARSAHQILSIKD